VTSLAGSGKRPAATVKEMARDRACSVHRTVAASLALPVLAVKDLWLQVVARPQVVARAQEETLCLAVARAPREPAMDLPAVKVLVMLAMAVLRRSLLLRPRTVTVWLAAAAGQERRREMALEPSPAAASAAAVAGVTVKAPVGMVIAAARMDRQGQPLRRTGEQQVMGQEDLRVARLVPLPAPLELPAVQA